MTICVLVYVIDVRAGPGADPGAPWRREALPC
jgi:hypothetical protein